MNKFEQLSSDDHQMSVAGGGVLGLGRGNLLHDLSHDACDLPIYLPPPRLNQKTDTLLSIRTKEK